LAEKLDAQDAIQFLEHQPIEKIADFMAAADALLVHLKKTELSRYVIPTKTIAYLAAGKPILMAMDGAAATLVSAAGAGLVIPSEDPVALARAIETLWSMPRDALLTMGRHGRDYFEAHLAKERAIDQYEEILRRSSDKVVPRNVSHPARRDRKHSADQGY
jgi:glycosyltransferase involved in cell wall biosynthesis